MRIINTHFGLLAGVLVSIICSGCTAHTGLVPAHGNWCGPIHPNNKGNNAEALDALDEACKHHDLCYKEKGYFSCECDEALINSLDGCVGSVTLNVKAKAIRDWFLIQPCAGLSTIKKPFQLVGKNFIKHGGIYDHPLIVLFGIPLRLAYTIASIPYSLWDSYSHESEEQSQ